MKRICIDFAPKVSADHSARIKRVSMALILSVIVGICVWQLRQQADVAEPASADRQIEHAPEEIQAADAAIRSLNNPWLDVLAVLDAIFENPADGALLGIEANVEQMAFKVSGEAHEPSVAQGIPSRLKTMKSVADAVLLGQEAQGNSSRPVLFTFEFRMREPS